MRMGSNHSQDRDLPLPSVEEHDEDVEVEVKDEEIDESVDMHSIPEQYPDGSQRALSDVHQFEEYEDDAHQQRYQQPHEDEGIDSGQQTPVPLSSPVRHALDKMNQDEPDVDVYPADSGVGMDTQTSSTLNDSLTDYKQHAKALWEARQAQQNEPPKVDARQQEEEPDEPALVLPETGRQTPDQDDEELEDPGTPESVIRHPVPESDYEYDSEYDYEYSEHEAFSFEFEGEGSPEPEAVPEAIATVKAPGGRYVIRPSLNSADVQTMAAMRREISGPLKRPEEYEQPQEEEYYDEDDNNDITPTLKDADEASPEEQAQAGVEEAKAEREAQEQQAERQRQEEERAERQRQEEERAEDEARQQEDARREAEQQEKEMREQEAREAEAEQQYEEEQEYEPEEEFEDQTPTKSGLKPKPSLVKLDVPVEDEDLTLGLTEEFDKVMTKAMDVEIPPSAIASRKENQGNDNGNAETHTPLGKNGKPKYLMRQATKVVVATSPSSIDPASRRVD
ncbi:Bud site selection protein bud4, partial [Ascosphaera atra]